MVDEAESAMEPDGRNPQSRKCTHPRSSAQGPADRPTAHRLAVARLEDGRIFVIRCAPGVSVRGKAGTGSSDAAHAANSRPPSSSRSTAQAETERGRRADASTGC